MTLSSWSFALFAQSLPAGSTIVTGSAKIQQAGATLTVQQDSNRLAINWQSFNIGKDSQVIFNQPDTQSIAFNRVLGNSRSEIFGNLTANGQVFLVNPNGILFGVGSQVNVGGLVASTRDLRDEDFIANRFRFGGTDGPAQSSGDVINQGHLQSTPGGFIVLTGRQAINDIGASISAPAGRAVLAAADQVDLQIDQGKLINVTVNGATVNALVRNDGLIQAKGGEVLLTARGKDALLQEVLNNSGIVEANSISMHDGMIVLDGGAQGVVANSGILDASAKGEAVGGIVKVLGDKVGLYDGTRIDVGGDAGGGTALIGGNRQGQGPEGNASAVYVATGAAIHADAGVQGNGGTIVAWGTDSAKVHGKLSAVGGSISGNGGFIETSGHVLDTEGIAVDTHARSSQALGGTWLLDPYNVTIASGGADSNGALAGNTWTPSGSGSTISNTTIQNALNAGNNVTITTTGAGAEAGNITSNAIITYGTSTVPATPPTLTLAADGGVTVNNTIKSTALPLNIVLTANANGGSGGAIHLNGSLSPKGGNLTINGPVIVGSSPVVTADSGNVIFTGTINADAVANARTLTINSTGTTTLNGAVGDTQALASLTTDSGGTTSLKSVTTSGAQTYNDAVNLNGTYITTANGGNGNFKASSGATLSGNSTISTGTGTVTFSGAVNSDLATNNRGLTISNNGDTTFSSTVGATQRLGALDISTITLTFNGNVAAGQSGQSLNIDSAVTNVNADISTQGGAISLSGPVNLQGSATRTIQTNAGSAAAGADMTLLSPIYSATDNTTSLNLNTGSNGTVYVASDLGTVFNRLASVQITGKDIRFAPIEAASVNPNTVSGVQLWLDASQTGSVVSSGGKVSQWSGQVNGNNAAQATAGNQPSYGGASTLNGVNTLNFDGDASRLTFNSVNAQTVFAVMQADPTSSSLGGLIGGDVSGNGIRLQGNVLEHTGTSTAFSNASVAPVWFNGALVRSKDPQLSGWGVLTESRRIGSVSPVTMTALGQFSSSGYFKGDVAEILLFDRRLKGSEVRGINSYLKNKWQLGSAAAAASSSKIDSGGNVVLNSPTVLGNSLTISASGVSASGTVDGDGVRARDLIISTTGNLQLDGAVGNTQRLGRVNLIAGSALTLNSAITAGANADAVDLTGGALHLNGDISTAGGEVALIATNTGTVGNGSSQTLHIDTTANGASGAGIYLGAPLDDLVADTTSLNLTAGTGGTAYLVSDIGKNTPLAALSVSANAISLLPAGFTLNPGGVSGTSLWLDASQAGSVISSGGKVSQWTGQASGTNAVQAVSASQPGYGGGSTLNGVNTLNFDGSASKLTFNTVGAQTVFVVARPDTTGNTFGGLIGWDGADFGVRWGGSTGALNVPGDGHDFTNPPGSKIRFNGTPLLSANPAISGWGVLTENRSSDTRLVSSLGQYFAGGGRYYKGDMAEVVVFNRALSTIETIGVENYLRGKWQLTGATSPITLRTAGLLGLATLGTSLTVPGSTLHSDSGSIVLGAGTNTPRGMATGGNIIINAGSTLTPGSAGQVQLYTGQISSLSGIQGSIGALPSSTVFASGSGNFRYDRQWGDAVGASGIGTAPAGTGGAYVLFREQPAITVLPDNQTKIYDRNAATDPALTYAVQGAQNGDAAGQIFNGALKRADGQNVGSYAISAGTLADQLGYVVGFTSGSLMTITPRPLRITADAVNKIYDGNAKANATLTDNRVTGDNLILRFDRATFDNKEVGDAKPVTVSGISAIGADAGNYAISMEAMTTANIMAHPLVPLLAAPEDKSGSGERARLAPILPVPALHKPLMSADMLVVKMDEDTNYLVLDELSERSVVFHQPRARFHEFQTALPISIDGKTAEAAFQISSNAKNMTVTKIPVLADLSASDIVPDMAKITVRIGSDTLWGLTTSNGWLEIIGLNKRAKEELAHVNSNELQILVGVAVDKILQRVPGKNLYGVKIRAAAL